MVVATADVDNTSNVNNTSNRGNKYYHDDNGIIVSTMDEIRDDVRVRDTTEDTHDKDTSASMFIEDEKNTHLQTLENVSETAQGNISNSLENDSDVSHGHGAQLNMV